MVATPRVANPREGSGCFGGPGIGFGGPGSGVLLGNLSGGFATTFTITFEATTRTTQTTTRTHMGVSNTGIS